MQSLLIHKKIPLLIVSLFCLISMATTKVEAKIIVVGEGMDLHFQYYSSHLSASSACSEHAKKYYNVTGICAQGQGLEGDYIYYAGGNYRGEIEGDPRVLHSFAFFVITGCTSPGVVDTHLGCIVDPNAPIVDPDKDLMDPPSCNANGSNGKNGVQVIPSTKVGTASNSHSSTAVSTPAPSSQNNALFATATTVGTMGKGRTHNLNRTIVSDGTTTTLHRQDTRQLKLTVLSSDDTSRPWQADADIHYQLTESLASGTTTGWTLTLDNKSIEHTTLMAA